MKKIAVRVKSRKGVETFQADNYKELLDTLAATGNDVFAFEYEETGDDVNLINKGNVIEHRNKGARPCFLSRDVNYGAYRDHTWEEYGSKTACENAVEATNREANGWWCVRAKLRHVSGSLYAAVYTDPYKD